MEEEKKPDGAKLVAAAVLGLDYRIVVVNDKSYIVQPPTIAKLAGAAYWLSEEGEGSTVREVLTAMGKIESVAHCLSWLVQGDDSLAEEFAQARLSEVVEAIETAFTLIDAANFIRLSALLRSVRPLIAKQNT